MDPNEVLRKIREHVKVITDEHSMFASRATHGEWLAEEVKKLDEWLSNGGFRPVAWQNTPARRLRAVRADDATHPRELPDPADEAAFAQRTPAERRAVVIQRGRVNDTVTVAELQEELNSHPTWCGESELPPDQRASHDDLRDS